MQQEIRTHPSSPEYREGYDQINWARGETAATSDLNPDDLKNHESATLSEPTTYPVCPKCGSNKQVWKDDWSTHATCHRAYCDYVFEAS